MMLQPKPILTVFAGPNGSGKSTLVNQFLESGTANFGVFINADEIAKDIARRDSVLVSSDIEMKAAIVAEEMRWTLLFQHETFMTETVMSSERWIHFFDQAHQLGYQIVLFFVTTNNPAINVKRVARRVQKGGHSVPEDKVISRYHKTMNEVLPAILKYVDEALFFDNSISPRHVLSYEGGKFLRPVPIPANSPAWVDHLIDKMSFK